MRVIAVIPARDEAATIADVAVRASRYVEQVIVVDDASGDGTAEILQKIPEVLVLHNESNYGKAGSLWRGIQHALDKGVDAVMTLDADGQHCPEKIPALIATAQQQPDRIIIGARLRGRADTPRLRRFANRLADFWISRTAGYRIADSQSGFRLYPVALLRQLQIPHDRAHSFVWESEVLIEAARLGFGSVPVTIDAIYKPMARVSHYRAIMDSIRIGRMLAWRSIQRRMHPPNPSHTLTPSPRKHCERSD